MSNQARDKILQAVQSAKEKAESAKSEFDRSVRTVHRSAGKTINLFGKSAVSEVGAIASEVRKANDTFYATCQMLVKLLDEECRPLLNEHPDYIAVREVRNTIKWLNEISDITSNFSASVNSIGLGEVAQIHYLPSIECKMAQSFWETKCDTWPGRAEEEAAERRREEEEKQKKQNKNEALYQKKHKKYLEWKKQFDDAMETLRQERVKQIEETHRNAVKKAMDEKTACEKVIQEAEERLASLGFFSFFEKREQKLLIQNMKMRIEAAVYQMEEAERIYESENRELDSWCEWKKEQLLKGTDKRYPLPPAIPEFYRYETFKDAKRKASSRDLEMLIPSLLELDVVYTVADIIKMPELEGSTEQRISPIVKGCVEKGMLERCPDSRKVLYRLCE